MPTRLTGLDAAFLYLETRTSHLHVGTVVVLDPATAPAGTLTRERLAAYVAERLHLAPPFRRRLVRVPFDLDHPLWVEDADVDLDFHVRRAALPAPGGVAELAELAGEVMGRPLDRLRPLWELWVVEGLQAGRVAVIAKTHHAAIDGAAGSALVAALLETSPGAAPPPPMSPSRGESVPSELQLLAAAGLRRAATPLETLRAGRRALESLAALLRPPAAGQADPPPAPFAAPVAPWNGAIGPHRRVAFAALSLPAVEAVSRRFGGTVNDVVLATVAGALRRFLRARGEPATGALVAMVPISVRGHDDADAQAERGNRLSMMLVGLPVDEPDPGRRLRRVSAATAEAKQRHAAVGADTLSELAELAPGALASLAARLYTRTRTADRHRPIWNTVVSNVPGPRVPLYCAGARMEALYPLGPVHEMNGLNVTVFGYAEQLFVGLNADRGLLPDVAAIAAALDDALAELVGEAT